MNTQLFTSALFLASLTAFAPSVRAQQSTEPDANQRALAVQRIAERTRSTADLEIVTGSRARLPMTGRSAAVFKVIDRASGEIHGIALDDRGQEVDMPALIRAEVDAQRARHGRIDPALAERVATARGDERIRVLLWARETTPSRIVRPLPEEAAELFAVEDARSAYLREVDRQRDEEVRAALAPVLARCRGAGLDAQPIAVSPVVYLELTAEQVGLVAEWDEVDMLYLDQHDVPQSTAFRPTVRADFMENVFGINGQGVSVAQVESQGGRIPAANPFLQQIVQDATFACTMPNQHAASVAGIMRSRHATVRGVAPNISLLSTGSCSGASSELQSRASFAADFGARIINLSFGSEIPPLYPYGNARFYDDLVVNRFRTVVAACGNSGATINPRIGEPANGFNLIAVGNFDDRGSAWWGDDIMNPGSSWQDPLSWHGDREEPDVAAPGTNMDSTTLAMPWTGFVGSGTSFSAPVVSGISALLVQRNGSLGFWPESVRAILMASAVHNIEGSSRLSESDGAGGVDAVRADEIARFSYGGWGGMSYGCGTPSPTSPTSMYLLAGKRTRVAIAYDTDASWMNWDYSGGPSADLDLSVVAWNGFPIATSASYDNSYEIAEFTPVVTGWYELRISRFACGRDPRYLGWAWTRDP